jgi:hypothetical protein
VSHFVAEFSRRYGEVHPHDSVGRPGAAPGVTGPATSASSST